MPELRIRREVDPESPRSFENLGTMICWHSKYRLGDIQMKGRTPNGLGFSDKPWSIPRGSVFLPVFLYDHGGISISTSPFSCPWDSGQVGWIYATPEQVRRAFGVKRISQKRREEAEEVLRSEVGVYDNFLTGNVWRFDYDDGGGIDIDSCGGFYGSTLQESGIKGYLIPEAEHLAEEAWERRFDDE